MLGKTPAIYHERPPKKQPSEIHAPQTSLATSNDF
jgi:hypothetical protein